MKPFMVSRSESNGSVFAACGVMVNVGRAFRFPALVSAKACDAPVMAACVSVAWTFSSQVGSATRITTTK